MVDTRIHQTAKYSPSLILSFKQVFITSLKKLVVFDTKEEVQDDSGIHVYKDFPAI